MRADFGLSVFSRQSFPVYWSARAAVTKHHRLGAGVQLKQQKFIFLTVLEGEVQGQVSVSLVSSEPSLLGLSSFCMFMQSSLCVHRSLSRSLSVLISSSDEDTGQVGLGPP